MKQQSLKSQIGEIEFRKRLFQQQIEGVPVFQDEFDSEGIRKVLRGRMTKTLQQMTRLRERGMTLSPYIEIGAERCQRSLVMENDLGAAGVAVDLSYHMLRSCDYYKRLFNKTKVPLRICCDANRLPFLTGSVPFAFCYETLHHFPDPAPIISEIYRVLSPGGYFFFDEEPYERILHLNLYKGNKVFSPRSLKRNAARKMIDYFFAQKACNETDYGIVEEHGLPLSVWKEALNLFEEKRVTLRFYDYIDADLFTPKYGLRYLLVYLLGGTISGICQKPGSTVQQDVAIQGALACPSCLKRNREAGLFLQDHSLLCGKCGERFMVVDDIAFLFPPAQLQKLYPDLFQKVEPSLTTKCTGSP